MNFNILVEQIKKAQQETQKKLYSKQEAILLDFVEDYFYPCIEDIVEHESNVDKRLKFFIAGGAVTSVFTRQPINDYDIYFCNENDLKECVKNIKNYASPLYETEKAITFNRSGITFQICKLIGEPQEIFNMYDFTVNMGAFVCEYNCSTGILNSEFILDDRFLLDIASRSLNFNKNTLYPISSLFRVGKYRHKGYKITNIELMKIALRISQLDIKTVKDIKEQVVGLSNDMMSTMREEMDKLDIDKEIGCPIEFIQSISERLPSPVIDSRYATEEFRF